MDRRTFLAHSAIALAGLAHQWAVTKPQALADALDGKPVDIEFIEMLEANRAPLDQVDDGDERDIVP